MTWRGAPKQAQDADAADRPGKRLWEGFSFNMPGSREGRLPTASRDLRSAMGTVCDTRFWQRCDDGRTVDSTTRGGW